MNTKSALFTGLLILWMGGSTYWYVCIIKKDCEKKQNTEQTSPEKQTQSIDTVKVSVKIEKDKENADLKNRLSAGIIISGFPYNSTEYNESTPELDAYIIDLKKYLSENSAAHILLTGYADNKGSEQYNIELSRQRALSIKNKLTDAGIPENQIIIQAEGEKNPIASNDTEEGRAQNRRVEIKLTEK